MLEPRPWPPSRDRGIRGAIQTDAAGDARIRRAAPNERAIGPDTIHTEFTHDTVSHHGDRGGHHHAGGRLDWGALASQSRQRPAICFNHSSIATGYFAA